MITLAEHLIRIGYTPIYHLWVQTWGGHALLALLWGRDSLSLSLSYIYFFLLLFLSLRFLCLFCHATDYCSVISLHLLNFQHQPDKNLGAVDHMLQYVQQEAADVRLVC